MIIILYDKDFTIYYVGNSITSGLDSAERARKDEPNKKFFVAAAVPDKKRNITTEMLMKDLVIGKKVPSYLIEDLELNANSD